MMAYTLRQGIDRQVSGPCLMLFLHQHGAHVIIGNSPHGTPRTQPWYAVVKDFDFLDAEEHYAEGASAWSALRKAAKSWAREHRQKANREREE